ncbi:hypothetical protein ABK040_005103 [Willaertia magna]
MNLFFLNENLKVTIDGCWNFLTKFIELNNIDKVKFFIDNKIINVNDMCSNFDDGTIGNYSLLYEAVRHNNYEITKYLLENNANVNCVYGGLLRTPLHLAICEDNYNIVLLLLSYGADYTITDSNGDNYLNFSTKLNMKQIIEDFTSLNELKRKKEVSNEDCAKQKKVKKCDDLEFNFNNIITQIEEKVNENNYGKLIYEFNIKSKEKQLEIRNIEKSLISLINSNDTENNLDAINNLKEKRNLLRKEYLNFIETFLEKVKGMNQHFELKSILQFYNEYKKQQQLNIIDIGTNNLCILSQAKELKQYYNDIIYLQEQQLSQQLEQLESLNKEWKKSQVEILKLQVELNSDYLTEQELNRLEQKKIKKQQELQSIILQLDELKSNLLKHQEYFPEISLEIQKILLSQKANNSTASNIKNKFIQHALKLNLLINKQLSDYKEVKMIHNGLNKVYLMEDLINNCQVVLKCIYLQDDNYDSIMNELTNIKRLGKHSRIVKVNGTFYDNSRNVVVIEFPYYKNGNLKQWLLKLMKNKELLNNNAILLKQKLKNIFKLIIQTVQYIHSNQIIHRDIKPENILIDDNEMPVIADFGSSKKLINFITQTHISIVGTFNYIAPEVLHNETPCSDKSDIWSIGVIMYECWNLFKKQLSYNDKKVILPNSLQNNDTLSQLFYEMLNRIFNVPSFEDRPSAVQLLTDEEFFTSGGELIVNELEKDKKITKEDKINQWLRITKQAKSKYSNIRKWVININRNNIVNDITKLVLQYTNNNIQTQIFANLSVKFIGESGIDEGGLTNEFYTKFYSEMLKDKSLFKSNENFNQIENFIISEDTLLKEKENSLIVFGILLKKLMIEYDKTVYLPLNNFIFYYLLDFNDNLINFCKLEKPLNQQVRFWASFLQHYDFTSCENQLGLKRDCSTTQLLQEIICEETFEDNLYLDENNNNNCIKKDNIPLTIDNLDRYLICQFRNTLFGEEQRKKLKLIKKGFDLFKFNTVTSALNESQLNVNELKMILCGQSYLDSNLVINELDFQDFKENNSKHVQLKCNLISAIQALNLNELRYFLIWITSLSSIPLKGFKKKVRIVRSNKFEAHSCSLQFEIIQELNYDNFNTKFKTMLEYSINSTQEERL